MAKRRNKVKFGLCNVHWAKIGEWGTDEYGVKTTPAYSKIVRLPGAVPLFLFPSRHREFHYRGKHGSQDGKAVPHGIGTSYGTCKGEDQR